MREMNHSYKSSGYDSWFSPRWPGFDSRFGKEELLGLARCQLLVKNAPANAGDLRDVDLIPELGRSSGGGNGTSLQYSCLENPMDREVWKATVHGVTRVGHSLATKPQAF